MRKPQGYGVWTDLMGAPAEIDTITCGHCQHVVFVKPGSGSTVYLVYGMDPTQPAKEEAGALCRVCMRAVCLRCHDQGTCTPFEKMIEASEARDRFIRQAGIRE